jgi:RNA recognition motif-containing protein
VRNKHNIVSPIVAPATPPTEADEAGERLATEQLGSDRNKQKATLTENTVFVGNLPFDITEEDLTLIFSAVGVLKEVRIHRDKQSAKAVYGFVEFTDPVHVEPGLGLLDNALVLGRRLRVERCQTALGYARPRSRSRSHLSVAGPQTRTSSAPPKPSMAPHVVAWKKAIAMPPQPRLPLCSTFPHMPPRHMLMPPHHLPMLQFGPAVLPVPLPFTMQAQTPTLTGLLAARST